MCRQSTHVLMNAVFSIIHFLHRYCVQTVFSRLFLHRYVWNFTVYGNSILQVVTEEFYGNPAQNFCNILWQLIIAHNFDIKYIWEVKKFFKKKYIWNQKSSSVTTCRILFSSCMWFLIEIEQVIMPKKLAGKKVTFLSNMAAIRGEKTPLKIWKIFSIHFFYITNPHTNFQLSKIRNGEKRSQTTVFP